MTTRPGAGATLCLGEALVDLICERPVASFDEAGAFVPHAGGAVANVALGAAAHGARVALAGGVGADAWGRWLRERLAGAGVDVSWLVALDGRATPSARVIVDEYGEPTYDLDLDAVGDALTALAPRLEQAVNAHDALFITSNTLAGGPERTITDRAHELALASGRHVLVDANLRLHRWARAEDAVAAIRAYVPGALLMRANRLEAELLTAETDPRRAARALQAMGAHAVVVTLGRDGALLLAVDRERHAPATPARVLSTVGAGDAFTGVLVAALSLGGYDPAALAPALPDAVAAGARATERWGAT